jgi:hypothetical protein
MLTYLYNKIQGPQPAIIKLQKYARLAESEDKVKYSGIHISRITKYHGHLF